MKRLFIIVCLVLGAAPTFAADPAVKTTAIKASALDEQGFPRDAAVARKLGEADAQRDLTNGVFKLKSAGLPSPSYGNFDELLKERCHYEIEFVCGCLVTEGTLAYIGGYNKISQVPLYQKYGTNILEELNTLAEYEWTHPSSYVVQPGDVLLKIARRHGITLKALMKANPEITSPKIVPGQRLVIPAAEPAGAKTTNLSTKR